MSENTDTTTEVISRKIRPELPEGFQLRVAKSKPRPIYATYQRSPVQRFVDGLAWESFEAGDDPELGTKALDLVEPQYVDALHSLVYSSARQISDTQKAKGLRTVKAVIDDRQVEVLEEDEETREVRELVLVEVAFRILETRPRGQGGTDAEDDEEGMGEDGETGGEENPA